jgi:hypothetical protein
MKIDKEIGRDRSDMHRTLYSAAELIPGIFLIGVLPRRWIIAYLTES